MTNHPPLLSAWGAIDPRLAEYLRRSGLAHTTAKVDPLHGDASTRSYVRVTTTDRQSVVLVLHPEPFTTGSLPQIVVGALFSSLGIPVPTVVDQSPELGILAVEDLGNQTLQDWLAASERPDPMPFYREALGHIATLQNLDNAHRDTEELPFTLALDAAKLTWELEFFCTEFLDIHRHAQFSSTASQALRHELGNLAEELAAEPRVLCHRDYHSRNLMVHRDRLVVIDFQDARLGPSTYDLVSLLRDCYVDLPSKLVTQLIAEHLDNIPTERTDDFQQRFDVMSVQRHLKALGTFGHQVSRRGRSEFASAIPRTMGYLRRTLQRYSRFERLLGLLEPHLPELRS